MLALASFFVDNQESMIQLLEFQTHKQKQDYNKQFEELITLYYVLSIDLLQEFAKNPESVGVEPIGDIFEIENNIEDETIAFAQNLQIFEQVSDFYSQSVDVFYLINKCYERDMYKTHKAMAIVNNALKAIYITLEIHMSFQSIQNANQRTRRIRSEKDRKEKFFNMVKNSKEPVEDEQMLQVYLQEVLKEEQSKEGGVNDMFKGGDQKRRLAPILKAMEKMRDAKKEEEVKKNRKAYENELQKLQEESEQQDRNKKI